MMTLKSWSGVTVLLFLSILSTQANAATVISTLPSDSDTLAFGETLPGELPIEATFGQTITVPAQDNVLTSFRFAMNDTNFVNEVVVNPVHFDAFVSAWDGEKASGAPLFTAGPFSTTNGPGNDGFGREVFEINTGLLELAPGNQYVLFFSTSNHFDGIHDAAGWGSTSGDPYPGGEIVTAKNGSNFGALMTTPWAKYDQHPFDFAFTATFVPEPSTFVLAVLGALGLLIAARRKR